MCRDGTDGSRWPIETRRDGGVWRTSWFLQRPRSQFRLVLVAGSRRDMSLQLGLEIVIRDERDDMSQSFKFERIGSDRIGSKRNDSRQIDRARSSRIRSRFDDESSLLRRVSDTSLFA